MEKIADYIAKNKIIAKKSLGQNFIYNKNTLEKIVKAAHIDKNDLVIEIGSGIGNMTSLLARYAGFVVAIEIDKYLVPHIQRNTQEFDNVRVINDDILKINIQKDIIDKLIPIKNSGFKSVKIIANLPYYITTPIITYLLENFTGIESMYFLMQKEVADRITAKPGTKAYGSLSIFVSYYSHPTVLFDVSAGNFIPKPDVVSSFVKFDTSIQPDYNVQNEALFFSIFRSVFRHRRKTLVNSLKNSSLLSVNKEIIIESLKELGLDERIRGEKLSTSEFARLSNKLSSKI